MNYRTRSNAVRAEARAHLIKLRNERLAKRGIKPKPAANIENASEKQVAAKVETTDYTSSPEILEALGLEAQGAEPETETASEASDPKEAAPKTRKATSKPAAGGKKQSKKKTVAKQSVKQEKADHADGIEEVVPSLKVEENSTEEPPHTPVEQEHAGETEKSPVKPENEPSESPQVEIPEAATIQPETDSQVTIDDDKVEPVETALEDDSALMLDEETGNQPASEQKVQPASRPARSAARQSLSSLKRPASSMRALSPVAAQLNPYSLERLPMIGPGLVWHLQKAGIHSLDDLAHADVDTLVSKLGDISRLMRLAEWVELAKTTSETTSDEAKSA